jgi:hypothetical protein
LLSDEETLKRLRITLVRRRKLSTKIIDEASGLPCASMIMRHFGNLREVYRLVGYKPKQSFEHLEARQRWTAILTKLALELATAMQKRGAKTRIDGEYLSAIGIPTIVFRVARQHRRRRENHAQSWSIERKKRCPLVGSLPFE